MLLKINNAWVTPRIITTNIFFIILIHIWKGRKIVILLYKICIFSFTFYTTNIMRYVFPQNPLPWAGCDTRSIFKQSKTGLNSFFFLWDWLSYQSLGRKSLPKLWVEENKWIHAFLKGISTKWNINNLVLDLNSGCQFHFLWQ